MNAGRYVGASVVVFIVRTVLNSGFYGFVLHEPYAAMAAAHPGLFRQVIPAFIAIDLVVAFLLTYVIVKAAGVFGGGVKGAVTLAILLALLGPIMYSLYDFFGATFYSPHLIGLEGLYQLVSYAIQGAIAAAIYKTAPVAAPAGAGPAI